MEPTTDTNSTQDATGEPSRRTPPKHLLVWRGAALIILMMTGYLVWERHFGHGLEGVPLIAGVAAAFDFALGCLETPPRAGKETSR
jgi:hypothetical protein